MTALRDESTLATTVFFPMITVSLFLLVAGGTTWIGGCGGFVNAAVPAGNGFSFHAGGSFGDFGFPRVLAGSVWFVAAQDRALNRRCRKRDRVCLGRQGRGR